MTENAEIPMIPSEGQRGLNDLLSDPERIVSLEQAYQPKETLSEKEWQMVGEVLHLARPLLAESLRLDSENPEKVYTVEMGADNGILFAYQNDGDPAQTTAIYLSSYGKKLNDWGEGLRIQPDRVLCHSMKVTSRRQIAPDIYTASEFNMRVSTDFQFVEGDPAHSEELRSRDMYTDNETFLMDLYTKYQMCFVEVDDPIAEEKNLAPLLTDAKELWRLALDANRGEIFWRLLTGKLEEDDLARIHDVFVDLGSKVAIDMEEAVRVGREIAGDLIAKSKATMRVTPITEEYLRDMIGNLLASSPVEVTRTMLPNDPMGIGKKRLLEKMAYKKLGSWKEITPDVPQK